jgi:hypothetical protein
MPEAAARFDSGVTKRIGLLSFGHWMPFPHSQARSGLDVLLQSIDLKVAAEELVSPAPTSECTHHLARQLGSTFPFGSSRHSTSRGSSD